MTQARVVVIAGASGAVGSALVDALLARADVARVVCLVRRPLARSDARLEQRTVDFTDLADAVPKDVEDAYCALGTTMKQAGSRDAFLAVDKDAVLAFAKACRAAGARRFMLVSALGANARSANFYMRTKGEVDAAIAAVGFDTTHIAHPSILDVTGSAEAARAARNDARAGERLGVALARGAAALLGGPKWKYAPIAPAVVARALVHVAFTDARGLHTHPSPALHTLAA